MRRIAILIVAIAGTLACVVLAVREVELASDAALTWSPPRWWHDLLAAPPFVLALVGTAFAVAGVICLWLAVGMLGGGQPDSGGGVELGATGASVVVTPGAIEHLLAGVLAAELRGVTDVHVRVTRRDERVVARTFLSVAPTDLAWLQARVGAIVERELRAATGIVPGEVTVEVDRLLAGQGR
ncbi:MAG TPA: hypothetical protein VK576_12130 [Thermoleophilia bacterium]|nr:hypothetical protein [Thermoleophilia bacterium]